MKLDFRQSGPMPIHCDNQFAIYIAQNLVFHNRTKHIGLTVILSEMRDQEDDCFVVHTFDTASRLSKLPHPRCFLIYVTSWTC